MELSDAKLEADALHARSESIKADESMLQVQRMSSYMLGMPYVSIKLLGPEPLVQNDDHQEASGKRQLMVIPDIDKDWRFRQSPYRNGLKFFIATPLYGSQGEIIGAFCMGDTKPRPPLDEREKRLFMDLTSMITNSIDLSLSNAQLKRRDELKRCVEYFLRHFLHESEFQETGDQAAVLAEEMDPLTSIEGNMHNAPSDDYMHIFHFAAKTLHVSMDVSGVAIFDLSSFVLTKKPSSIHGKVHEQVIHSRMTRQHQSGWDQSREGFAEETVITQVPAPALLGASEAHVHVPARTAPMGAEHIHTLCQLLTTIHLGEHFREDVPEAIAKLLPEDTVDTLMVPIMGVDRQPFALLCCYSRSGEYAFMLDQMVHTAIQHVRAIGYMIMDVVARQSVVLADRAKSSFISNMSHELRTPLHGILASTELLSDTSLDGMQRSYAHTIESCGHGLLELVNHVLDYTKLYSDGKSTVSYQEKQEQYHDVDLVQLLQEVCDSSLVGHLGQRRTDSRRSSIGSMYDPGPSDAKLLAKSCSVELVIDIEERQEGWFTFCDSGGIRRVLTNLIGNALKFTEEGYILVSLQHTPISEDKIRVSFRVKDTGCGISRTFLDQHLFQPFSQEDPLKGGTGLGLSIVNELMRDMENGMVRVESLPRQGTDIVVSCDMALSLLRGEGYIPRLHVAQSCSVHMLKLASDPKGTSLARNTLCQYLQAWWGFQVLVHEEPADARFLSTSEASRDILLLNTDVQILGTLLQSVPKEGRRLPAVVVLTNLYHGRDYVSLYEEYKRAGGALYLLQKPVGPARLEETLTACLASSHPGAIEELSKVGARIPSFIAEPACDHLRAATPSPSFQEPPSTHLSVPATPMRRTKSWVQDHVSPPLIATPMSPVSRTLAHTLVELDMAIGDEATSPRTSPRSPLLKPLHPASSAHVLFADDNAVNRQVLRAYLRKLSISCSEARDGSEVILKFSSQPSGYFNLILMDYSMPNIDGLSATLAIRQLEEQRAATEAPNDDTDPPKTTIYMLSGTSSSEILRQAYAAGADGYLSKPLSFKVFVSLLKSIGLQ
ncbi:hypothetical protein MEQU1_001780 [Malassezia equina]|uniref:Uncharacterized protein n=1 Tax=Malassezia equina TaxID=1381935 RepID=A0AAF0EEH1_9BASI|nr:hypothetical protein MEQU1_001780 [Malassezia equina]